MSEIRIWDTTLRDAHQSLWATRMTTAMMTPIAPEMDEVGFYNVEVGAAVIFDTCIHHLKEDPWERLRTISRLMPRTTISHGIRGQNVLGWDLVSDDVAELVVRTLVRNGVRRLMVFDPLNDLRSTVPTIRAAKQCGTYIVGLLVYTISPVHTDEYYARKAREFVELGVDAVEIKDPSGLLTPERIRTLAPAFRAAIGDGIDLHLHTHCNTGLGPLVYLEALSLGVNVFHTASAPLANGASQPATELLVREARRQGFSCEVDDKRLPTIARYFHDLAVSNGRPLGVPAAYDPDYYRHHMPGGMLSNLKAQLDAAGMGDRLPAVLEEIPRVREELGWPIMVSPTAQFVALQSLFNVTEGERYRTVPAELRKYALGWYGELPKPIDPNILDRITGGEEPIRERPGTLISPMVERFRREHGPFDSDEDLLLALSFPGKAMTEFREARRTGYVPPGGAPVSPAELLLAEISRRPEIRYFEVRKGATRLVRTS